MLNLIAPFLISQTIPQQGYTDYIYRDISKQQCVNQLSKVPKGRKDTVELLYIQISSANGVQRGVCRITVIHN